MPKYRDCAAIDGNMPAIPLLRIDDDILAEDIAIRPRAASGLLGAPYRRRAANHTPMPSCTSTFMRLARRFANK